MKNCCGDSGGGCEPATGPSWRTSHACFHGRPIRDSSHEQSLCQPSAAHPRGCPRSACRVWAPWRWDLHSLKTRESSSCCCLLWSQLRESRARSSDLGCGQRHLRCAEQSCRQTWSSGCGSSLP